VNKKLHEQNIVHFPHNKNATAERSRHIEALYKSHWREICARLRKVFGAGPPEPEDLAQEAFAKFTALPGHSRVKHPQAFLFKTALNLGYDSIKRVAVARRHIEMALQEADLALMEQNSPEDVYSLQERLTVTTRAFNGLSEKQREIVIRSRIYGESFAQIRAATGWSNGDIHRQLKAAHKILRARVQEAEGTDE